jgi:hypothetical protein
MWWGWCAIYDTGAEMARRDYAKSISEAAPDHETGLLRNELNLRAQSAWETAQVLGSELQRSKADTEGRRGVSIIWEFSYGAEVWRVYSERKVLYGLQAAASGCYKHSSRFGRVSGEKKVVLDIIGGSDP